jgi:hypothetical protein
LHTIITHLALDNDMCQRLRNELETIAEHSHESPQSWQDLQKLPYLDACVKEGLRYVGSVHSKDIYDEFVTDYGISMATGSQKRSTRVFPNTMVSISGWTVPEGVSIQTLPGEVRKTLRETTDSDFDVHLLDAYGSGGFRGPAQV